MGESQGPPGRVRKISLPPSFDPRTVQPVANRYTDYAIQAAYCPYLHTFTLPCNTIFSEYRNTPSEVSLNYTRHAIIHKTHILFKLAAAGMCIRLLKPLHKSATFNTATIRESYNFNKTRQHILKHDKHINQSTACMFRTRFANFEIITKSTQ